jgi:hypothetical protein
MRAGALPFGHHSVSRRFRRKVRESNPRTMNRHALAERCLNHSANLPVHAFIAFIESDPHGHGWPRWIGTDARLVLRAHTRRASSHEGFHHGRLLEHERDHPARQSLDRAEPSAAPQSGRAGSRSLIASVFVNVAMTETSLHGEDTRSNQAVKAASPFYPRARRRGQPRRRSPDQPSTSVGTNSGHAPAPLTPPSSCVNSTIVSNNPAVSNSSAVTAPSPSPSASAIG